jgi:lipid II isoglutaminyl synthase (glutamine-hydrolysing)
MSNVKSANQILNLKNLLIIYISKTFYFLISKLNLGAGSTWPGEIALRLNGNFIKKVLKNSSLKIVLIAGTNGKTTTSTLMHFLLEKNGKRVFQNEEGANLLNGVASAIVKNINFNGKFNYDTAVFEIDENTLPLILNQINPDAVILLNLFRDQLDRYGEVNTIAQKWHESLKRLNKQTKIFLNADDPLINFLGTDLKTETFYFGVSNQLMKRKEIPHDVDSIYCPKCGGALKYKAISYSHLGDYHCPTCGFERGEPETYANEKMNYPLQGLYNIYNTNAVILTLSKTFNFPINNLIKYLVDFRPAFGRQEEIIYRNHKFKIFLGKNPAGFNQAIGTILAMNNNNNKNILLVLNDRIPDGRDVSWIWDVEFEDLSNQKIVISGDRTYDMALRMKYANQKDMAVEENLNDAINKIIEVTSKEKLIYVLATYTGMLEVRKILTGKKLL